MSDTSHEANHQAARVRTAELAESEDRPTFGAVTPPPLYQLPPETPSQRRKYFSAYATIGLFVVLFVAAAATVLAGRVG